MWNRFHHHNIYKNLAIPVKDLVRYWWNNIADQEAIIRILWIRNYNPLFAQKRGYAHPQIVSYSNYRQHKAGVAPHKVWPI